MPEQRQRQNAVAVVQQDLAHLVQRGMAGDREVLPAIRDLLDQTPELWTQARTLSMQVEQAWLRTLTGDDLVSREVLIRQVDVLKTALAGPHVTPLEQLLIERICACWLAVQHAELRTAERVRHSTILSQAEEQRLDKVHRRFLMAVKSLAQVRKLLVPKVQVNIANQQVNVA